MTRIIEINKILLFAQVYGDKHGISRSMLLRETRREKLAAELTGYQKVLDICGDLHLVAVRKQRVTVTNDGMQYLNLMTRDGDRAVLDSNLLQKKFLLNLIKNLAASNSVISKFFDKFQINFSGAGKWFVPQDTTALPDDLLVEIGFLKPNAGRLEIEKSNSSLLSKIRNHVAVTEDEIIQNLEKQRRVGKIAEEFTMNYEKKRLISKGLRDMALAVQRISRIDPYAGYDILSFSGNNQSYAYDRRIEVKGTSTSVNRFYWSRNEIEVAKRYGDKYWIYFWKNVEKTESPMLKKFQNPYNLFFRQKYGKVEPTTYELKW